jgi:hypothetical protein
MIPESKDYSSLVDWGLALDKYFNKRTEPLLMKDLYRDKFNKDVYSDNNNGSYSDEYVKWLETSPSPIGDRDCEELKERISELENGLANAIKLLYDCLLTHEADDLSVATLRLTKSNSNHQ